MQRIDFRSTARRKTRTARVGNVNIGSDHPISVQTMTNTDTADAKATLKQIERCCQEGAELIRVSVPDEGSTAAIPEIVKHSPVPVIADVHFHYKRGIEALKGGVSCVRINPGTLLDPARVKEIVMAAKDANAAIRVGVNAGSLDEDLLEKYKTPCPEALFESAMRATKILEDADFFNTKISVKASSVSLMMESYKMVAQGCDYPLHLGVTEAGTFLPSCVKSAMGIGGLLYQGIGDTIRVSVTAPPEEEIPICYEILKSLNLRNFGVTIVSCPSCARQQFDVIALTNEIEKRSKGIKTDIKVSILGCVVNGIGEAKVSDIGVTGAGSGNHLIYKSGQPFKKATKENLVNEIMALIEEFDRAGQGKLA